MVCFHSRRCVPTHLLYQWQIRKLFKSGVKKNRPASKITANRLPDVPRRYSEMGKPQTLAECAGTLFVEAKTALAEAEIPGGGSASGDTKFLTARR